MRLLPFTPAASHCAMSVPRDAPCVPLSILTSNLPNRDVLTSRPSPLRCVSPFARVQLLLPGEAESGSAGVQTDKEYPGRRCANGASGPWEKSPPGVFFTIGHRCYASE